MVSVDANKQEKPYTVLVSGIPGLLSDVCLIKQLEKLLHINSGRSSHCHTCIFLEFVNVFSFSQSVLSNGRLFSISSINTHLLACVEL